MTQDTAQKAPPTAAQLEEKVKRLQTQVETDTKASQGASDAFARAVKSGNVDEALKLADARTAAKSTLVKSESQLKTAAGAVASAKHAANADKVAAIHDAIRDDPKVGDYFSQLEGYGVKRITLERSEETSKLLVNSVGPTAPKKARASTNGGNRGTAEWMVGGQAFTSRELIEANVDKLTDKVAEHFQAGNFRAFSMTREAERIHKLLTG